MGSTTSTFGGSDLRSRHRIKDQGFEGQTKNQGSRSRRRIQDRGLEFQEKLDSSWEEVLQGQSALPLADVKQMLEEVGIRLPTYKVRDIVQDLRNKGETDDETLSKPAFEKLCQNLTSEDVAKTFKTNKQMDKNAAKLDADKSYGYHTVLDEEQAAFADWINDTLSHDQDVNHKLPLSQDGSDMYEKMTRSSVSTTWQDTTSECWTRSSTTTSWTEQSTSARRWEYVMPWPGGTLARSASRGWTGWKCTWKTQS